MINTVTRNVHPIKVLKNLNIKNPPKQRIKENIIRELTPYFQIARIFGISPYSISNTNFTLSKNIITYSVIYFIIHTYCFVARTYVIATSKGEAKLKNLYYARLLAFLISAAIDSIIPLLCNRKFQESLHHLKLYDMTMKFRTDENNSFVKWRWILIIMNIGICLSIAGVSYKIEKEQVLFAIYLFSTIARFLFGILKFMSLAMSITMRFQHLNLTLSEGSQKLLIYDNQLSSILI